MKAFTLVHLGGEYLTTIKKLPREYGEEYLNKVTDKVRLCAEENTPVYALLPKIKEGEEDLPDRIKQYPLHLIPSNQGTLQYYVAMAQLLNDGITFVEIGGVLRNGCVEEFSWVLAGLGRDENRLIECLRNIGYDTSKSHKKLRLPYKILEDLCL